MLPGKTTPSAGSAFLLASNKPAASPSVLSAKHAPAGATGGVVVAAEGKRAVAARAAVVGRGGDFSDDDIEPPKEFSADIVKKVAEEMSSLLRSLGAPKDSSFPEQASFCKEVEALQTTCDAMVDGAGFDEDGAITMTMLLGVQARINLLLGTDDNKQSPQDMLLSCMGQIKVSVEKYMSVLDTKPTKLMTSYDLPAKRGTIYDTVEKYSIRPAPTVCSYEEVKMVLQKTLSLLETEPVHSRRAMVGLFYKVRSNCRALLEDVEKNGVSDKTGAAIMLIHVMALGVLGQHKKYFNYEDAAADTLLASLRRLEVAIGDYMLGGPSAEDTDD